MEKDHGYEYILKGEDERPDSDYDAKQLARGIEVEKEHTLNEVISKIIAKDHLDEFANYYDGLDAMEEELEKSGDEFKPEDLDNIIEASEKEDKHEHTLVVKYRGYCNKMKDDSLLRIIAGLGYLGNSGHSFSVVLDGEGDETLNLGWDGDGSDHIIEIIKDGETLGKKELGLLFK